MDPSDRKEWEVFSIYEFKLYENMAKVTIQFWFFIISQFSYRKKTTNVYLNYVGFYYWLNFKCSPLPLSMAYFPGSKIPLPQLKYRIFSRYQVSLPVSFPR